MNEKLNTQDVIDALAQKHSMNKKDAALFVKELFLLIEESLEKDKIVKLKGLGTFKVVKINSRESVNVNTGERFVIPEHRKISFIPDTELSNILNKPFAHFETILLDETGENDKTTTDDDIREQEELFDSPAFIRSDNNTNEIMNNEKEKITENDERKRNKKSIFSCIPPQKIA
ncbi:DNA-binding protein HU [termite gut metagenome]|uniref:DNA-binding protein HU n=1 Tax=termite gut metagenome TaxID=433724 RepID=A0A5J4SF45_9ZZZZ